MIDAPTVGIGRLLKEGGRFLIPHHQRYYSWTEDELDQLFKDVYDAKNSGHDEYFVGLMVFKPESERIYTILDGQQRLATTVIILAAIRSWLTARGFEDDFRKIQSDYIAARELGEEEMEPSLVLNQANNDVFVRHVVHESPVEDIKRELAALNRYDPNRALLEAILFCRIRVDEIVAEVDSPTQGARRLFELVRYLRDSVKVVRLNVPNEVNAYTVFETLNDRGLDLSVLDLAKNHLFGQAGDETHLRDIQGGWSQMMANLTNVKADDFLKAWWNSRNGRVQSPQLFARFKERVSSRSAAGEVSRDMLTASEQYAALEVADDPLWSGYSEAAKERVRNLKLLGGQQVHPVLLSALERFPQGEVERLLRLLEILIVRYQLVGGGRTGRLEISCARLAHRIFERRCVDTTEGRLPFRPLPRLHEAQRRPRPPARPEGRGAGRGTARMCVRPGGHGDGPALVRLRGAHQRRRRLRPDRRGVLGRRPAEPVARGDQAGPAAALDGGGQERRAHRVGARPAAGAPRLGGPIPRPRTPMIRRAGDGPGAWSRRSLPADSLGSRID